MTPAIRIFGIKGLEPFDNRRGTPGDALCRHHKDHREVECLCNRRGAASIVQRVRPFVQPADTFDNGHVGPAAPEPEDIPDLRIRQRETVKIPAGAAGDCRKVGGVDIVHPHLEGLDPVLF